MSITLKGSYILSSRKVPIIVIVIVSLGYLQSRCQKDWYFHKVSIWHDCPIAIQLKNINFFQGAGIPMDEKKQGCILFYNIS